MRVIIAGSRHIWNYAMLESAIEESGFDITSVVCGMAPGADCVGWAWAHINGIPIDEQPADWDRYGKRAGPLRNVAMAARADALILLWDGISLGSRNMLHEANRVYLETFTVCESEWYKCL